MVSRFFFKMRDIISHLYADGNHLGKQKKLKMTEGAGLNAGAMFLHISRRWKSSTQVEGFISKIAETFDPSDKRECVYGDRFR